MINEIERLLVLSKNYLDRINRLIGIIKRNEETDEGLEFSEQELKNYDESLKNAIREALQVNDIPAYKWNSPLSIAYTKKREFKWSWLEGLKEGVISTISFLESIKHNDENRNPLTEESSGMTLIMKGGGIKGVAYIGALKELNKYFEFDWYVGTSAGAISALLLASGYQVDELEKILSEKKFSEFKDANFIKRILNFIKFRGLYKADSFVDWMDELLSKKLKSKTEVKLHQLPKRATVYATRSGKEALIFDSVDPATKKKSASFAARCSMSIPLIFTPQYNEGLRVFDGGAQNNFPIESLKRNYKVNDFLGLYLGQKYYKRKRYKTILGELIGIWTETMDSVALEKYPNKIIVIDPSPISTMQFNLSEREKRFLLDNGKLGALEYLNDNNIGDIRSESIEELTEDLQRRKQILIKDKNRNTVIAWIKYSLVIILIVASIGFIISKSDLLLSTDYYKPLKKEIIKLSAEKAELARSLEDLLLTDNPLLVDIEKQTEYIQNKLNRIDSINNIVRFTSVELKGENTENSELLSLVLRATDAKNIYKFYNRSKVLDKRFRNDAMELVQKLKNDVIEFERILKMDEQ